MPVSAHLADGDNFLRVHASSGDGDECAQRRAKDSALYDVFRGKFARRRGEVVWFGAQGCCGAIGERTGGGEPVAGGSAAVYERGELGKGTGGGAGEVDAGGEECQGEGCGTREV